MTVRIDISVRVVGHVRASIPGLWIFRFGAGHRRVGAGEPALRTRGVPSPKEIEAALRHAVAAFLGGELQFHAVRYPIVRPRSNPAPREFRISTWTQDARLPV